MIVAAVKRSDLVAMLHAGASSGRIHRTAGGLAGLLVQLDDVSLGERNAIHRHHPAHQMLEIFYSSSRLAR